MIYLIIYLLIGAAFYFWALTGVPEEKFHPGLMAVTMLFWPIILVMTLLDE